MVDSNQYDTLRYKNVGMEILLVFLGSSNKAAIDSLVDSLTHENIVGRLMKPLFFEITCGLGHVIKVWNRLPPRLYLFFVDIWSTSQSGLPSWGSKPKQLLIRSPGSGHLSTVRSNYIHSKRSFSTLKCGQRTAACLITCFSVVDSLIISMNPFRTHEYGSDTSSNTQMSDHNSFKRKKIKFTQRQDRRHEYLMIGYFSLGPQHYLVRETDRVNIIQVDRQLCFKLSFSIQIDTNFKKKNKILRK